MTVRLIRFPMLRSALCVVMLAICLASSQCTASTDGVVPPTTGDPAPAGGTGTGSEVKEVEEEEEPEPEPETVAVVQVNADDKGDTPPNADGTAGGKVGGTGGSNAAPQGTSSNSGAGGAGSGPGAVSHNPVVDGGLAAGRQGTSSKPGASPDPSGLPSPGAPPGTGISTGTGGGSGKDKDTGRSSVGTGTGGAVLGAEVRGTGLGPTPGVDPEPTITKAGPPSGQTEVSLTDTSGSLKGPKGGALAPQIPTPKGTTNC